MCYKILNLNIKNGNYKSIAIISIFALFSMYFCLDYNFLNLLLFLIVIYIEIKSVDENLSKLNWKRDCILGLIVGFMIITKQTSGVVAAVILVGYKWILIRNLKDLQIAFKISLIRGIGVLLPVIVFVIYLVATNSLYNFIVYIVFYI